MIVVHRIALDPNAKQETLIVGSKDAAILPCEHGNGAASSGSGRKPQTKLAAVKQEPTRGIKSQG